jgi:uncharacterized protein (DUF433 family)
MFEWIAFDGKIMGGRACIRSLCIPVYVARKAGIISTVR